MNSRQNSRQRASQLPSAPSLGAGNGSGYGRNVGSTTTNMRAAKPKPAPKDLLIVLLPFYDVMEVLIPPMELASTTDLLQKQPHKQQFQLKLTADQRRSINYHVDQKEMPRTEIQVRFFQTTTLDKPLTDDFPPNCALKLDDEGVTLPEIIPTRPKEEPKRLSRPVDVTKMCQKGPGPYRISVEWTADQRSWAIAVYLVHRVDSQILYQRMMDSDEKHQSIEVTKRKIVKRLIGGGGDDNGVVMDQMKVRLVCPLTKVRMQMPAKCLDCTHSQCFDLQSYLMMNEMRPVWKCPICSGDAPYDRLIIDDFFKDVIDHVDKKMVEVELIPDVRYKGVKKEEASALSDDDNDDSGVVNAATFIDKEKDSEDNKVEDKVLQRLIEKENEATSVLKGEKPGKIDSKKTKTNGSGNEEKEERRGKKKEDIQNGLPSFNVSRQLNSKKTWKEEKKELNDEEKIKKEV